MVRGRVTSWSRPVAADQPAAERSPVDSWLWDVAFLLAAALSFVGLLLAGNGMTFFLDDWGFIKTAEPFSAGELLAPYNEHWMTGLKLLFQSLLATFGLTTYMPYLVVLLGLHVITASALYVHARRHAVALVAFAVALTYLLLGSASDNFFFAFQIGWTAATAAGAWALVIVLDEPPLRWRWLATVLLVVAVATSGVGLFFLAAVTAVLVLSESRRRSLWVALPAVVSYAIWYLVLGAEAVRQLPELTDVFEFVRVGIAFAIGEVTGLGPEVGLVLGILFAIAAVASLVLEDPARWGLVAASVGLLTGYVLAGLARVYTGVETAMTSYYIYPGGFFVLTAIVSLLAGRGLVTPGRALRVALVAVAVTTVAVTWNLGRMSALQRWYAERAHQTRAAIALTLAYGGSPAVPTTRGWDVLPVTGDLVPADESGGARIPGVTRLTGIIDRFGSPLQDDLALLPVEPVPEVEDLLFGLLLRDEFTIVPVADGPVRGEITVADLRGVTADVGERCVIVTPEEPGGWVELAVVPGSSLYVTGDAWGVAVFKATLHGTGDEVGSTEASVAHEVSPEQATRIGIPDIGSEDPFLVRYAPWEGGSTTICGDR